MGDKTNIRPIYDVGADDSDKTWTVPAGETWNILSLWVQLAASAVVGNRMLVVEYQDAAGYVWWRCTSVTLIAAGATTRIEFAPGVIPQAASGGPGYSVALPNPCVALAGGVLRVWDWNAIDDGGGVANHDDMTVYILVEVHEA